MVGRPGCRPSDPISEKIFEIGPGFLVISTSLASVHVAFCTTKERSRVSRHGLEEP